MYPFYYTIVIILSIIALFATVKIAKDMSKNDKEASSMDEVESLKKDGQNSSIPLLSVIYAITFVLTIILIWIFIF